MKIAHFCEITAKVRLAEKNRKITPVFCQNIQHSESDVEFLSLFIIITTYEWNITLARGTLQFRSCNDFTYE